MLEAANPSDVWAYNKTQYTDSVESFSIVVESASGVPTIMAGGPRVSDREILHKTYNATKAKCAGVCIGRNVFNNDHGKELTLALRSVVHDGLTADEALKVSGFAK